MNIEVIVQTILVITEQCSFNAQVLGESQRSPNLELVPLNYL